MKDAVNIEQKTPKLQKQQKHYRNYLNIVFCLVIVIGVFFRGYNIEQKVYWHDEVYTSIRTAGYNGDEIVERAFNEQVISPRNLLQYQTLSPQKTWRDTLEKLIEHPEHPPLYYLLSRAWQELFGSSIAAVRSLSAVFSLLLFPVVFWLCRELFDTSEVGFWTIGIIAISPVQVLYAQESREYSLLLVTTALSCLALIGAVKRDNWQWWGFYAVSLAFNFYVSLIAAYIAIAQTFYIVVLERFRFSKKIAKFVISGLVSLVLFAPWLWVIYKNFHVLQNKTEWTNTTLPFIELLRYWELHLVNSFIDLHPQVNGYVSVRIIGFLAIFVILCYRTLCLKTKPQTWLLLVVMTAIPSLMLIVPDLVQGGIKSIMTRYFLPNILMIQIAVAYWLSQMKSRQDWKRIISIFFIVGWGIISLTTSSQANTWWNKVVGYHNPVVAQIINNYRNPLVVSNDYDINIGNIISLSYLLDRDTRFFLFKKQNIPSIEQQKSNPILLWNLPEATRISFQAKNNCQLKLIEGEYYPPLWEILPNSSSS